MSRWSKWVSDEPRGFFSTFVNEAEQFDQGNPTPQHLNGQSPGEKAKQMGLQSDGHGGYKDPNTGQLVARTVNGELVFYDGGPGGGAVSDGAGGDKLATAQPSWQDPVSGMMLTPPSKPETPEEIAAIPDAIPATSPFGYEKFMQQKKMTAYQEREQQPEQGPEGDMDLAGMEEDFDPKSLAKRLGQVGPATFSGTPQYFSGLRDRMSQTVSSGGSGGGGAATQRPQPQQDQPSIKQADTNISQNSDPTAGLDPEKVASIRKLAQSQKNPADQKKFFDDMIAKMRSNAAKQDTPEPDAVSPAPQAQQNVERGNQSLNDSDQENLRTSALEAYQNWATPRITAERRMETKFAPMMEALNGENVNPELRSRLIQTMVGSMKYEGRDNEASSDLSKAEFQALQENRDRILRGYGGEGADGSTHNFDAIRQFQKEMSDPDLDEDLLRKAFDALPPDRQKIYKGGDMSAWQGFKKFASQRGKGGYTGLDLDMNTMQMEHFIDNSQSQRIKELIKKEKRDMSPEEQELVDFIKSEDNQFWSRQSPNEQKSSRNIQDFFGQRVDPLDELGEDFFDFREMKLDPARLDLKGKEKGYIQNMIDTDDDGNISLKEMDEAGFDSHMDAVNQIYDNQKNDLLEALSQQFDTKGLLKMGPKAFEKALGDDKSDVSEEDRSRYDMLRNLQSKVKGYNSSFDKRITQALGIPTGFIQSERARTNGSSPEIYKTAIKSLVGKSKEEQKTQIEKIKKVFSNANSTANKQRGQGNTDADIKKVMYQTLFQGGTEEGLFSEEMFENSPGLKKLRDKFMSQSEGLEDIIGDDEDMGFEIEDILEIIQEMNGLDIED